jgi:outer membrane lipoprotein SlyB
MERREVMAVYPDEAQARRAAEALRRSGIASEVRIGERADEQQALRNEMQEEMEHTVAGPGNVGPFTKEMTKGAGIGTMTATAFGAIAALPFGLLEFGPTLWQRFLVAAVVGAVAGATVGFVAGGGLSMVGPAAAPLSAERGVTLAVEVPAGEDTERVARLLAEETPLRVDVTDLDGRVVDTVQTHTRETVPHELGRTLAQGAEDPRRPE